MGEGLVWGSRFVCGTLTFYGYTFPGAPNSPKSVLFTDLDPKVGTICMLGALGILLVHAGF